MLSGSVHDPAGREYARRLWGRPTLRLILRLASCRA